MWSLKLSLQIYIKRERYENQFELKIKMISQVKQEILIKTHVSCIIYRLTLGILIVYEPRENKSNKN